MNISRKDKMTALMDGFGYTEKEASEALADMGE